MITDKRISNFERVAARRQEMTVILENVHDPHNIGAVLRTCDAVGIDEVYILYTDDQLDFERLQKLTTSATGVKKWFNLFCFRDLKECFDAVRKNYDTILATHLNHEARSMYGFDLTGKVAFLFGNEHAGLSEEAIQYADHNIIIPQMGMAQSLNISVACAVTIYEALRQRMSKGMYDKDVPGSDPRTKSILDRYIEIHNSRYTKKKS